MLQHNIPLAFSDHFSEPTPQRVFPWLTDRPEIFFCQDQDWRYNQQVYSPLSYEWTSEEPLLCNQPFTLASDGSNDTGVFVHVDVLHR